MKPLLFPSEEIHEKISHQINYLERMNMIEESIRIFIWIRIKIKQETGETARRMSSFKNNFHTGIKTLH